LQQAKPYYLSPFHRKDAESAKKRYFSFAVERDGKRKKINRYAIFFDYNCPQG
jgi:hypothetical protein